MTETLDPLDPERLMLELATRDPLGAQRPAAASTEDHANRAGEKIDLKELINLCAIDSVLFSRTFFAKTFRQETPQFHREIWSILDDPLARLTNIQVYRDGAKTTLLRTFAAKRIAYGISHNILVIGKSEGHATRSIRWLRKQIEFNRLYSSTFQLRRGSKWQDHEAEIIHGVDEYPIWIVGMGIEGSTRGINLDDFRPDLIIVDDVGDRENSSTPDQRQKIEDLIYGSLVESLAPASETPDAKLVMLQTPLNREDVSTKALADPQWRSMKFGCWTKETANLSLDQQVSAWPSRWPSDVLRESKRAYMRRNQTSIWMREKECRLITPELSAFKPEWLNRWTTLPPALHHVLVIDPVPPPSPLQVAKGFADKDYEAFAVVGVGGGKFYIREVSVNRGHDPLWTVNEFFRLIRKYHVSRVIVESVGYQRALAWLLRQAMQAQRLYRPVEEFTDQRSKFLRITDGLTGPASNGVLLIPPDDSVGGVVSSDGMAMFVQQFNEYPAVNHDDAIEVVAVACSALNGMLAIGVEDGIDEFDEEAELAESKRGRIEGRVGETLCP